MPIKKVNKSKRIDWAAHLEGLRTSGLSRKEYAKLNGLNYSQLNYWYNKAEAASALASKPANTSDDKPNNFIELVAPGAPLADPLSKLRITTPDGLKIELAQAWTPQDTLGFLQSWSQR